MGTVASLNFDLCALISKSHLDSLSFTDFFSKEGGDVWIIIEMHEEEEDLLRML